MARRPQRTSSPNYTILGVVGVAVVLAVVGGVFISSTREKYNPVSWEHPERFEDKDDELTRDLDKVSLEDQANVPVNLPPHQRVFRLLVNARRNVCVKDLQKALSMCEEALKIDPAYTGDVYFSMGLCYSEHAILNKLPYADQIAAGEKKLDLYRRAIEAYGKPGAKTGFQESLPRRRDRVKTSIKMEKNATEWRRRQIAAGILRPEK